MRMLIMEGAVTQRFASASFADASYTKTRVTYTAAQHADPLGNLTLGKLADDATGGTVTHLISLNRTFILGEVVEMEIDAVSAEYNWLQLILGSTAFGGTNRSYFNVATGAKGTAAGSNITPHVVKVQNNVCRCFLTATVVAAGTGSINIAAAPADNTPSYVGVLGSGIYIGNPMLTTGTVGRYAPSGRAKDVLTSTVANAGGMVTTVIISELPRTGTQCGIFVLHDGTNNNRLYAFVDSAGALYVGRTAGSVADSNVLLGYVGAGQVWTLAGGWDGTNSTWSLNGATVITCGALPTAANSVNMGDDDAVTLLHPLMGYQGPSASFATRPLDSYLQQVSA